MSSSQIPATVRAVITDPDLGRPTIEEIPFGTRAAVKELGPDAVVVSTRALGLNPTDYKHSHGDWSAHKKVVVGTDSAGVVLQVGNNVRHIKVGDRVAGMVYGCGSEDNGAAAEAVVIDAANAFPLPPNMSFLEGAALTATHMTVVQTFYMRWNLPKPSIASSTQSSKNIILIWGGSTAVGHHAVQLARLSGFRVFVTASPAAHGLMRKLGADEVFDYRDPDVVDAIKKAAGDEGVFAAYDTAGSNLGQCIDAIGPQGGKVMTTTPFDEAMAKRRSDVTPDFVLIYTVVGYPFKFAGAFDFPAIPEDRAASLEWVTKELPALLAGWVEGEGSPLYKGQSLRVLNGGLEQVYEGLDILRRGAYKAEKLVYSLA